MKKLLVLATTVLIGLTANAQKTALDKKIRFGFKIDMGSSWLGPKENYVTKDGSKFYFSYGFISDFTLTDNYIISTGLNITNGGGKLNMQNSHGFGDDRIDNVSTNAYSISLQYIEIPLALKLKTDAINGIKYWGLFGTYLDVNIGARLDGKGDNNVYAKEKITSAVVPVNLGLDIGAGIEYPFNNKTYGSFGLGFHNGFVDVTKQSAWNDGKVNLNGFFLRTAVFF